jgi:hypothetical protein
VYEHNNGIRSERKKKVVRGEKKIRTLAFGGAVEWVEGRRPPISNDDLQSETEKIQMSLERSTLF